MGALYLHRDGLVGLLGEHHFVVLNFPIEADFKHRYALRCGVNDALFKRGRDHLELVAPAEQVMRQRQRQGTVATAWPGPCASPLPIAPPTTAPAKVSGALGGVWVNETVAPQTR
jgi:hypothetical protein